MINSIRNTVLFLLNKDNRGYVSPSEFDYFAKLAQLEIFESYFDDYARSITAQNARKKALNYGDTASHIQNKIDIFSKSEALLYTDVQDDSIASPGEERDYFSLPTDTYKLINITYAGKVVEPIQKHKFDMIVNSNLTAPSVTYPVYKREASNLYIRPLSIQTLVTANYIKKPSDPHWGYVSIGGDPVYNSDSTIDFEISQEDETDLVIKICKYAGLSIREADVIQVLQGEEQNKFTKENI